MLLNVKYLLSLERLYMSSKKIIDMSNVEALKFLLKSDSYCTLKLPKYFDFQPILNKIHKENSKKSYKGFFNKNDDSKNYNDVNYVITVNKADNYSFRRLVLTNPVSYVSIVQDMCEKDNWDLITQRFEKFKSNSKIKCCSIPVESDNHSTDKKEQILNWWTEFEQITIAEALNFEYMMTTDISNFYPSIYTHSIPWALHDRDVVKQNYINKSKVKFYGDKLDEQIRGISYGQTNGIPQGSKLYDFIAEMILGYCDMLLGEQLKSLKIDDYKIIRYRDDYRIFSNSSSELDVIFKTLVNILNDLNLQINDKKTHKTNDIISNSIKKDKIYGLLNPTQGDLNIQKKLFVIREVANLYPNSGLLVRMLHSYYKDDIIKLSKDTKSKNQIISLIVDIMKNNSRVYPECIAILSKLFTFYADSTKSSYIRKVRNKVSNKINADYLNIWLQRLTITDDISLEYDTPICEKIYKNNKIWNTSWSCCQIDEDKIIDRNALITMQKVVTIDEFDDFLVTIY